jgi:hypothetical protein
MEYILTIIILILIFNILKLKKEQDINNKKIGVIQDFIFGITKTLKEKKEELNENIVDSLANGVFYKDIMFNDLYNKKDAELEQWVKKNYFYNNYSQTSMGDFSVLYINIIKEMLDTPNEKLLDKEDLIILKESLEVTEDNVLEIKGEIAIYKDMKNGVLDVSNFNANNIDYKLSVLFNHINNKYIEELRNIVVEKNK